MSIKPINGTTKHQNAGLEIVKRFINKYQGLLLSGAKEQISRLNNGNCAKLVKLDGLLNKTIADLTRPDIANVRVGLFNRRLTAIDKLLANLDPANLVCLQLVAINGQLRIASRADLIKMENGIRTGLIKAGEPLRGTQSFDIIKADNGYREPGEQTECFNEPVPERSKEVNVSARGSFARTARLVAFGIVASIASYEIMHYLETSEANKKAQAAQQEEEVKQQEKVKQQAAAQKELEQNAFKPNLNYAGNREYGKQLKRLQVPKVGENVKVDFGITDEAVEVHSGSVIFKQRRLVQPDIIEETALTVNPNPPLLHNPLLSGFIRRPEIKTEVIRQQVRSEEFLVYDGDRVESEKENLDEDSLSKLRLTKKIGALRIFEVSRQEIKGEVEEEVLLKISENVRRYRALLAEEDDALGNEQLKQMDFHLREVGRAVSNWAERYEQRNCQSVLPSRPEKTCEDISEMRSRLGHPDQCRGPKSCLSYWGPVSLSENIKSEGKVEEANRQAVPANKIEKTADISSSLYLKALIAPFSFAMLALMALLGKKAASKVVSSIRGRKQVQLPQTNKRLVESNGSVTTANGKRRADINSSDTGQKNEQTVEIEIDDRGQESGRGRA